MKIILILSNKSEFRKYVRKKNLANINYYDIIDKLIKSDVDNNEPSQDIINVYLYKRLLKSLRNNNSVAYAISKVDDNLIDNLYNVLKEKYSEYDLYFDFVVLNPNENLMKDESE